MEAFAACGLSPDEYASRQRPLEEVLPWDHIDPFVRREYLAGEYAKATRAQVTPDCREGCTGCGVNRYTDCFVHAKGLD